MGNRCCGPTGSGVPGSSPLTPPRSDATSSIFTRSITYTRNSDDEKLINQYSPVRTIGHGSYSKVKLAFIDDDETERSGQAVVLKIVSKSRLGKQRTGSTSSVSGLSGGGGGGKVPSALDLIYEEIRILEHLGKNGNGKCPYVIRLLEVLDAENEDLLYLVMDFCAGGQVGCTEHLNQIGEPFEEEGEEKMKIFQLGLIRSVIRNLVLGVEWLHCVKGVYHGDIKPDNLLFLKAVEEFKEDEEVVIAIADFGTSRLFKDAIREGDSPYEFKAGGAYVGTPAFQPPEVHAAHDSICPFKIDIWCIGITLYTLLFRIAPFRGETFMELSESIGGDEPVILLRQLARSVNDGMVDDDVQDEGCFVANAVRFLKKCLTKNPAKRPTIMDLKNDRWWDCPMTISRSTYDRILATESELVIEEAEGESSSSLAEGGESD